MDNILDDIEKAASLLRSIIKEAPKLLAANADDIKVCEKELNDIEHVLELSTFNASKGYYFAKEIQNVRIRRRYLKDQNELLEPLVEVVTRMRSFENDLNKAIGEIRKVKSRHECRSYKMRVREDLQAEIR
jgi:hypothetical protein